MMDLIAMALDNLEGNIPANSLYYQTKEEAIKLLREVAKVDLGDDAKAWISWGKEHYQKKNERMKKPG